MESLTTGIEPAELCRKYNIHPPMFYQWREKFLQGGRMALTGRNGDATKQLERENQSLKRIIGELTMANDLFKKTLEGNRR